MNGEICIIFFPQLLVDVFLLYPRFYVAGISGSLLHGLLIPLPDSLSAFPFLQTGQPRRIPCLPLPWEPVFFVSVHSCLSAWAPWPRLWQLYTVHPNIRPFGCLECSTLSQWLLPRVWISYTSWAVGFHEKLPAVSGSVFSHVAWLRTLKVAQSKAVVPNDHFK